MALFRRYEQAESVGTGSTAVPLTAESVAAKKKANRQQNQVADQSTGGPVEDSVDPKPHPGKSTRTPTRKEAEAARMERLNPTLTKKELKERNRAAAAQERQRSQELFEAAPERVLLRNYVDSRWTFSEFVWPVLLILLATAMVGTWFPRVLPFSTLLAWITMLGMAIDVWICWRGFKRELASHYPRSSKRGLLGYLMSRMMTPRRWRQPGTAVDREPLFNRQPKDTFRSQ